MKSTNGTNKTSMNNVSHMRRTVNEQNRERTTGISRELNKTNFNKQTKNSNRLDITVLLIVPL